MMKKTIGALLLAALMSGTGLQAATYYWDTVNTNGYTPGNGTWETDPYWTQNGTTLITWPGTTTDDVINSAIGTSTITVSSVVSVNSLTTSDNNNKNLILIGGKIQLGAGGLKNGGNGTQLIYSDLELTTDQTWTLSPIMPIYGNVSGNHQLGVRFISDYRSPLQLYGTNTFGSLNLINNNGTSWNGMEVLGAAAAPIGGGPVHLEDSHLLFVPVGSGATLAITAVTNSGATLSFNGFSRLLADKGNNTSLDLTLGNAGDSGPLFVRQNRAVLYLQGDLVNDPYGIGKADRIFVAGGAARVPVVGGLVAPYMISGAYLTRGATGGTTLNFLNYTDGGGFTGVVYDLVNTFSGADNTKLVSIENSNQTLTANTSVRALRLQSRSVSLNTDVKLSIGNGSGYAGLLLGTGDILPSASATGMSLDFGSDEGIIHTGSDSDARIEVPIAGTGGLTLAGPHGVGQVKFTAANTYSGTTTLNHLTLNIGDGGTSGSLGASTYLSLLDLASKLNFNRTDSYAWTGCMSGVGTVQHSGSGTLSLTTTDNSTMGNLVNGGTGTLVLNSAAGKTNAITTTVGFRSVSGGTMKILSGVWTNASAGSNTGDFQWRGEVTVSNATVIFGGGYFRGHNTVENGGAILFVADRCGFGQAGSTPDNPSITVNDGGLFEVYPTAYNFYYYGLAGETLTVTINGGEARFGVAPVAGTGKDLELASGTLLTTNRLTLNGGKLTVAGTIKATQTAPLVAINFNGGILSANGINLANMDSMILTNAGGVLAPGMVGTAGLTTLTGNYLETSPNAALALDLGGTTAGSAFTNAAGYHDCLNIVNGTGTFSGRLSVNLINGYVPAASNKFTVVKATGTAPYLTAAFANVSGGKVWAADGFSRFDVAVSNNLAVIVSNYTLNAWASASGASWTNPASWSLTTDPSGSDLAAFFGPALASPGVVTLDAARTVRSLYFTNANGYTLSGSPLTLIGDAVVSPQITVALGSHAISTALALSNALTVAVNNAADKLTISGNITGSNTLTKTGNGTLALGGNNILSALTVSSGTVSNYAGTSTVGPLTLATGATFHLAGGTLTSAGLTLAAGSRFSFPSRTTAVLYIAKGVDGGAIDTANDVEDAVTAGLITVGGAAAIPYDFLLGEEVIGSVTYVTVMLRPASTGAVMRVF